jgi:hypothetical protein
VQFCSTLPSIARSSPTSPPQRAVLTEPLDLPGLLDARGLQQPEGTTSRSTRAQHATVRDLVGPLEWFFNCVGALFYIMGPEEVDENIQRIQHVQVPLGDIVLANEDPKMTTIAAGLAGMAAIGVVHATLADPTTAPPAELADYFYGVAKDGLDAAIECNPLGAVKICALVAMYNIIVHATVALSYLGTSRRASNALAYFAYTLQDLGISLARRFGIDASTPTAGLSRAEFDNRSRTYRTLVHLQW